MVTLQIMDTIFYEAQRRKGFYCTIIAKVISCPAVWLGRSRRPLDDLTQADGAASRDAGGRPPPPLDAGA
jgi:hypothetical protein